MNKGSKRLISRMLAFVMLFTSVFSNTLMVSAEDSANKPTVWDFTGTNTTASVVKYDGANAFSDKALSSAAAATTGNVIKSTTGSAYKFVQSKEYAELKLESGNFSITTASSLDFDGTDHVAVLEKCSEISFKVKGSADIEIKGLGTTDSAVKLLVSGESAYYTTGKSVSVELEKAYDAVTSSSAVYKYRGTEGTIKIKSEAKAYLNSITLTPVEYENADFSVDGIGVIEENGEVKINVGNKELVPTDVNTTNAVLFVERGKALDDIKINDSVSGNAYKATITNDTSNHTKTIKVEFGTGSTYNLIIKEQATFTFPGEGDGVDRTYNINVSAGAVEFSPSDLLTTDSGIEYNKPNYVKLNFAADKLESASATFADVTKGLAGKIPANRKDKRVNNIEWNTGNEATATSAKFVINLTTGGAFEVETVIKGEIKKGSIKDIENIELSTATTASSIELKISKGIVKSATGSKTIGLKAGETNTVLLTGSAVIADEVKSFADKYTKEANLGYIVKANNDATGIVITKEGFEDEITVTFEHETESLPPITDLSFDMSTETGSVEFSIENGIVTNATGSAVRTFKTGNIIILNETSTPVSEVAAFVSKYADSEYVVKTHGMNSIEISKLTHEGTIIVTFDMASINELTDIKLLTSEMNIYVSEGKLTSASGVSILDVDKANNIVIFEENTNVKEKAEAFVNAYSSDEFKVVLNNTGEGIKISKDGYADSIEIKFEAKKPDVKSKDFKLNGTLIKITYTDDAEAGKKITVTGSGNPEAVSDSEIKVDADITISSIIAELVASNDKENVTSVTDNGDNSITIERMEGDNVTIKFTNREVVVEDSIIKVNVGEVKDGYVTAEFVIEKNPGINNYTFFVNYDSSVIQAETAAAGTVGYNSKPLMGNDMMNNAIAYKPSATNSDFAGLPNGLKPNGELTASELGRLKFGGVLGLDDGVRVETKEDGTLFTIKFKVLGYGNSNISIDPIAENIAPFNGLADAGTAARDIKLESGKVVHEDPALKDMNFVLKFDDMNVTVSSTAGNFEYNGDFVTTKPGEDKETIVVVDENKTISIANRTLTPEGVVTVTETEGKTNSVTITYVKEAGEPEVRIITFENEKSEPAEKPSKDKFTISAGDYTISVADGKAEITGIDSKYDVKTSVDADGNVVISFKDEEGAQDLINSIVNAFKDANIDDITIEEYTDPTTGEKGLKLTIDGEEVIIKFTIESEEPPVPQDFETTLTINGETIELKAVDGVLTATAQPGFGKSVTKDDGTLMVPYVGKDRKTNLRGLTIDSIQVGEGYKVVSFEKFVLKIARADGTDEQEMIVFTYGDYNFDGVLNLSDSLGVMQYLTMPKSEQNEVPEYIKLCVDVNTDGILNLSDSLAIMNYLIGAELPLK